MGYELPRERLVPKDPWRKVLGQYALATLLSLAIVTVVLRLWQADLRLPFIHRSDAVFTSVFIKSIIDNGWYLSNPHLGAPGGSTMYDFPMSDNLHFLCLKLLSLFSHHWPIVQNTYFLLTFPLTTLSALFVFRRFQCAYAPSLLGSLLFTCLPYHFMRGEVHLFLASYYMVPLAILLILEVFLDLPIFTPAEPSAGWRRWLRPASRILVCCLVASAGVYYGFFACFLLFVAGFACACRKWTLGPMLKSTALVAILCLATVLNLLPNLAYRWKHGSNPQATQRDPFHSDIFGLKTVQLLLPITNHRIPLLSKLKAGYNNAFRPLVNENDHASLGVIGSVGFLVMLGGFLFRRTPERRSRLEDALAVLTLACFFLCSIGGLGSLFSLLITPKIRGYNRVSVYIAFFSFFTLVLILERCWAWTTPAVGWQRLRPLLVCALLLVGVWDQTSRTFVPNYSWVREEFTSDEVFIRKIEALLPEGAMVFQLPYAWFPEQGQIHQMVDYDHFRGYLHSDHLRWSYGAYKGRSGDTWIRAVASQPVEEIVRRLKEAGFRGIYIDRAGFADGGKDLESKLSLLLHEPALTSPNNLLAFFELPETDPHGYAARATP